MAKGQGKYRYEAVAEALLADLKNRVYRVGDLLPTEAELCATFGISRHTARSALNILASRGLIRRVHGVGSKILSNETDRNAFVTPNSVGELLDFARESRFSRWTATSLPVREAEDDLPEFDAASDVVRVEALRIRDGKTVEKPPLSPLSWMRIYIAERYAGVIAELPNVRGALGEEIERLYGERILEIVQRIEAVAIGGEVAEMLGVEQGHAGLRIRRAYVGKNAGIFEVTYSIHPAGRFTVVQHLRRGAGG